MNGELDKYVTQYGEQHRIVLLLALAYFHELEKTVGTRMSIDAYVYELMQRIPGASK